MNSGVELKKKTPDLGPVLGGFAGSNGTTAAGLYPVNLRCTGLGVVSLAKRQSAIVKQLLLLLGLCGLALSSASAQTVINQQTPLPLPSSALFRGEVGNAPADGTVQGMNPPLFKWLYMENGTMTQSSDLRTFRFQLSTSADFSSPYWDIVCSNNFYNFVPPITNSDGSTFTGTCYWRIIYMDGAHSMNIATGDVHNFTLSTSATNWDRSMLADQNYLMSVGQQHPHMLFWQTNLSSVSAFMRTANWTTPGANMTSTTNLSAWFMTQPWWNSSSLTNLPSILTAAQGCAEVAFSYYMSGSNKVWDMNGAANTLNWYATEWMRRGMDRLDGYQADPGTMYYLALSYDWLYPFMTPAQRANVLHMMERTAQYYAYDDGWWFLCDPPATNGIYTNTLTVPYYSDAKIGSSHSRYDSSMGLVLTEAALGESSVMRELFPLFMNYSMAQFDPYQGDEGRGYSEQSNFKVDRQFAAALISTIVFRDAKLWQNPLYFNMGKFFAYWEPTGLRTVMDPWGDLGYGVVSAWYNTRYYDLALLTGSGEFLRQFRRTAAFPHGGADSMPIVIDAFMPYYYQTPLEQDWSDNSFLDIEKGWAISGLYPPSNWAAFTNGVGFAFQARPAGSRIEHSSFTDGQIDLWAYGASLTVGGGNNYVKHPMYYNGLFVDGIGVMNPQSPPVDSWYSRITAFTNTSSFTYVAANLTKAFNRSNYNTGGLGNWTYQFYTYATNTRPYIADVQRHIVFPHKKYLVIYDQMQATKPAQFQWLWHIWEPTSSVNPTTGSFTYTSTNLYGGTPVKVYVQHIVDPTLLGFNNVVGTNLSKYNPFTGENYYGQDGDTGPFWNSSVWVYNKTPVANWHFLTVIYPVKVGDSAPIITRIDDYTVKVVKGGVTDTINFSSTGGSAPPTVSLTLQAGPSPPQNLRVEPTQ